MTLEARYPDASLTTSTRLAVIDWTVPWARRVSVANGVASITAQLAIANFISTSLHIRQATTGATERSRNRVVCGNSHSARCPRCHDSYGSASLRRANNPLYAQRLCIAQCNRLPNLLPYRPGGEGDGRTTLRPRSSRARRLRLFIRLPRYGRQTIHESVLHWRSAMNKDQ